MKFRSFLKSNRGSIKHLTLTVKVYSQIRILNTMYNETMTKIGWPFCNMLECLLFVGGFCATMLKSSSSSVIVVVIGGFFMILSLTILLVSTMVFAKIHTSSEALLRCIRKYRPLGTLGSMMHKSYRVCGIQYGMFFIVKRHSLFTVMGGLSNAAISAVLYIN